MQLKIFFISFLPFLSVFAAPLNDCTEPAPSSTETQTTTTISSGTSTVTQSIIATSGTGTAPPITTPTAAYTVISARSGSPIHLLPMNAAGGLFYLGGLSATYCPLSNTTECPPGDVTAFLGLGAMDTEVPGGQIVYVAPDGSLGFTQAHSAYTPPNAVLIPFTYIKQLGASFGDLGVDAFGATGFMACKGNDTSTYQVFAALQNATVPTGNISDCLGFDALTSDYASNIPAAWEYT